MREPPSLRANSDDQSDWPSLGDSILYQVERFPHQIKFSPEISPSDYDLIFGWGQDTEEHPPHAMPNAVGMVKSMGTGPV